MYEFEFKFSGTDFFVKCDVSVQEGLDALKTGLLRNKAISEVKLFSVTGQEHDGASMDAYHVYNVEAAKAGQQPWGIIWQ